MFERTPRHSISMECPICFESYNTRAKLPIVLLCGHTFCRSCTILFVRNQNFRCPIDMIEHAYRQNEPGVNFLLMDEITATNEMEICPKHNNFMRFFCVDHNEMKCQDCIALECIYKKHELRAAEEKIRIVPIKHSLASLLELSKIQIDLVGQMETKINKIREEAEKKYEHFSRRINKYSETMKPALASIVERADKMMRCLEQQRKIRYDMATLCDSYAKQLDNWKQVSEELFLEMRSSVKSIQDCLKDHEKCRMEQFNEFLPPRELEAMIDKAVISLDELDVFLTKFSWKYEGKEIYVIGSWTDWKEKIPLKHSGTEWESEPIPLKRGKYEFKFIVDDNWYYDLNQPNEKSKSGTTNNILKIE